LQSITHGKALSCKSNILALHPFLDTLGVLRVGGRLRNSQLTPDQKHPILLPRHSRLTDLIITEAHVSHHHAGPQLMQAVIQKQFWIIGLRDSIRFHVRKCVICIRHKAAFNAPLMGDLPKARVTPGRPFLRCGFDYAGPFILKPDLKRSKVTIKSYLAVFICFVTRAIHLEVVSDLSTAAFLAAFRRFVSRRGRPSEIHSDCGTNFVGAARELKDLVKLTLSSSYNLQMSREMTNMGIKWVFNPPGAPHFGGLWEARVNPSNTILFGLLDQLVSRLRK